MILIALTIGVAIPWGTVDASKLVKGGPLLLFGGPKHEVFLGCLRCYRTDPFSVWNEKGEYGDPESELSIWNLDGPYGSGTSPMSPWNPNAETPPLVVSRNGNFYGYFTLNTRHPERVRRNDQHQDWGDFELIVWLLENYDWVITHLEEVRVQY
jgi:hypothetical protein